MSKTVVGDKQGHTPCKVPIFFASVQFHGDHKSVMQLR